MRCWWKDERERGGSVRRSISEKDTRTMMRQPRVDVGMFDEAMGNGTGYGEEIWAGRERDSPVRVVIEDSRDRVGVQGAMRM